MNEHDPTSKPAPPATKPPREDDTVTTYFRDAAEHDGWSEIRRRTPAPPKPSNER